MDPWSELRNNWRGNGWLHLRILDCQKRVSLWCWQKICVLFLSIISYPLSLFVPDFLTSTELGEFASVCICLFHGFRMFSPCAFSHTIYHSITCLWNFPWQVQEHTISASLHLHHPTPMSSSCHEPVRTCQNNWEIHWHGASAHSPAATGIGKNAFFKFCFSLCIQYHSARKPSKNMQKPLSAVRIPIQKDIFDFDRTKRILFGGIVKLTQQLLYKGCLNAIAPSAILWRFCTREQVRCTVHLLDWLLAIKVWNGWCIVVSNRSLFRELRATGYCRILISRYLECSRLNILALSVQQHPSVNQGELPAQDRTQRSVRCET